MEYKDISNEMLEDELMKFGALTLRFNYGKYILPERNHKLAFGFEFIKNGKTKLDKKEFLERCCLLFNKGVNEIFDIIINQTKSNE